MKHNERNTLFKSWIENSIDAPIRRIETASSDASFRSYYRVILHNENSYIAVDSPPEHENNKSFIRIAKILDGMKIPVPRIIDYELNHGFFIVSDLGKTTMLMRLRENMNLSSDFYTRAVTLISKMQNSEVSSYTELPLYDKGLMLDEMKLFTDWYCKFELKVNDEEIQKYDLYSIFNQIADRTYDQEKVFVHRDFHSRNIMINTNNQLGLLDFQDAVIGPITYDLVSLLRDCYISLPEPFILEKIKQFHQETTSSLIKTTHEDFLKDFDLMGVQRHLKAIGIFSRLKHRDKKENYILDIPRTRSYLERTCNKYEFLQSLSNFLRKYSHP